MLSPDALKRIKNRRGDLYVNFPIKVEKAALLVIDMQNAFCAEGAPRETPVARGLAPAINLIAGTCRSLSIPVIFLRHMTLAGGTDIKCQLSFFDSQRHAGIIEQFTPGLWVSEVWEGMDVKKEDLIIDKTRYSPFIPGSSPLERILRSLGKDTLIITGIRTNICCESTVRDAMMLDYKVIVAGDAVAAFEETEHQNSLDLMGEYFADVVSTAFLIEELKSAAR